MKKNIFVCLAMMGLMTLISCKKDEVRAILRDNPVAPTLTVPSDNIELKRANAAQLLEFTGSEADYGFNASITYTLQAAAAGTNFSTPLAIATSSSNSFPISVADLNAKLLTVFPADQSSAIEMRVTSSIIQSVPTLFSPTSAVAVTTYGYPRLILSLDPAQSIISKLGDGNYTGYVKLTAGTSFTVTDPETSKVFGGTNGTLSENGSAFSVPTSGWYSMTVNTAAMTYDIKSYMVGLVGDATPNGWNSPDSKMDYDVDKGYWTITIDLVAANFKFRLNDDWGTNWGGKGSANGNADNYTDATTVPLAEGGKDIPVLGGAGNYTITLNITDLKATVVKN